MFDKEINCENYIQEVKKLYFLFSPILNEIKCKKSQILTFEGGFYPLIRLERIRIPRIGQEVWII